MDKEAIRLMLHQSSANYREPESFENRRTYPLPPFSTVIGAIHKACGYTDPHDMDVSIQGRYGSMGSRIYRDHNFLNSTFDDRNILVKMVNDSMLSNAYVKVAESRKNNSSFERNVDIKVYDRKLLDEYQCLKEKKREVQRLKEQRLNPELERLNAQKKQIADQRRQLDGKSAECRILKDRESEIKKQINDAQSEFSDYERRVFSEPFSKFRVLASSIKRYELLYDVDLILHITSGDSNTMDDIYNHAYDITSLGRSEDFVELKSVDKVTLTECEEELTSEYSAYVALENVRKKRICTKYSGFHSNVIGTKYVVPKMYVIGEDGRRIFDKKKVLYTSEYTVCEAAGQDGIFVDRTADGGYYIVNLI